MKLTKFDPVFFYPRKVKGRKTRKKPVVVGVAAKERKVFTH